MIQNIRGNLSAVENSADDEIKTNCFVPTGANKIGVRGFMAVKDSWSKDELRKLPRV